VVTFTQGEEEGIDPAYSCIHSFSLTPSCMEHVQICAGRDLMEKTLTKVSQLLKKISKAAATRRDWETRLSEVEM
jgi:hypothetical protein